MNKTRKRRRNCEFDVGLGERLKAPGYQNEAVVNLKFIYNSIDLNFILMYFLTHDWQLVVTVNFTNMQKDNFKAPVGSTLFFPS